MKDLDDLFELTRARNWQAVVLKVELSNFDGKNLQKTKNHQVCKDEIFWAEKNVCHNLAHVPKFTELLMSTEQSSVNGNLLSHTKLVYFLSWRIGWFQIQ